MTTLTVGAEEVVNGHRALSNAPGPTPVSQCARCATAAEKSIQIAVVNLKSQILKVDSELH